MKINFDDLGRTIHEVEIADNVIVPVKRYGNRVQFWDAEKHYGFDVTSLYNGNARAAIQCLIHRKKRPSGPIFYVASLEGALSYVMHKIKRSLTGDISWTIPLPSLYTRASDVR